MTYPRDDVQRLQSRTKPELKQLLADELGDSYHQAIPGSLKNAFLRACYDRIHPGHDPIDRAREHPDYSESWREKRKLATALRMLLSALGVREPGTPLTQLDKPALAQLIVAIRLADEGETPTDGNSANIDAPSRPSPSQQIFDEILTLDEATEEDVKKWVGERQPNSRTHAVYVLDCTAPRDAEPISLSQLRARVEKEREKRELSGRDKAAASLTDGERVYYVGYTNDVVDRVARHCGGASYGGGTFTNTFPPQAIVDVTWFETEQEARRMEAQIAAELTEDGERFAYWA